MAASSEKYPAVQGPSNGLVGDEKIELSTRSSSSSHNQGSITKLDSHIVKIDKDAKDEVDPLQHLPPNEKEIIKRQLDMPDVKLNYFSLYRFATTNDLIFIFTGCIASIIAGAVMPLMTVVFGELSGVFQKFALGTVSSSDMQTELNKFTMYVVFTRFQFLKTQGLC